MAIFAVPTAFHADFSDKVIMAVGFLREIIEPESAIAILRGTRMQSLGDRE